MQPHLVITEKLGATENKVSNHGGYALITALTGTNMK